VRTPRGTRSNEAALTLKRLFDVTVSAGLLLLLSPLLLGVLAAMALDMLFVGADRGSFLDSSTRISRGRRFDLLKFRSARPDGTLTWAGRAFLRGWYLDELPQLINVLKGDISLVGPRPWPPEMVEEQVAAGKDYRNRVPAGLTGPAQVTKGLGTRYEELDLEYVKRLQALTGWRLVVYDSKIMRRTLGLIARGEGLSY
jgi:lipopolysaccharide/colanic/teichoic acid biosynthesis glycosyltransferase